MTPLVRIELTWSTGETVTVTCTAYQVFSAERLVRIVTSDGKACKVGPIVQVRELP